MNSPSCSNVSWNNTGCLGPIGSEAVSGRSPDPSRADTIHCGPSLSKQCSVAALWTDGLQPPGLCCSRRNVVLFSCDLETFSLVTATVTSRCSCILSTFHRSLVCRSLAYSVNYFRRGKKCTTTVIWCAVSTIDPPSPFSSVWVSTVMNGMSRPEDKVANVSLKPSEGLRSFRLLSDRKILVLPYHVQ
jgi:hypothetical protein